MKQDKRPEAFGVFKPVGCVVASFRSEADMMGAASALQAAGFGADDVNRYSAAEMLRQADLDIAQASPLASIGQELNLVKAHRELAEQGQCFLVVRAPGDAETARVTTVMRACHATRAQKYGTLLIEELIEVGSGQAQVAESPDRGLDSQTVSGREGDPEPGAR